MYTTYIPGTYIAFWGGYISPTTYYQNQNNPMHTSTTLFSGFAPLFFCSWWKRLFSVLYFSVSSFNSPFCQGEPFHVPESWEWSPENDWPESLVLGRALNSLHNREGVGATPRFRSAFPRKGLQFFDPIVGTNLNDGNVCLSLRRKNGLAPSWYETTDFSDVFQNDESSFSLFKIRKTLEPVNWNSQPCHLLIVWYPWNAEFNDPSDIALAIATTRGWFLRFQWDDSMNEVVTNDNWSVGNHQTLSSVQKNWALGFQAKHLFVPLNITSNVISRWWFDSRILSFKSSHCFGWDDPIWQADSFDLFHGTSCKMQIRLHSVTNGTVGWLVGWLAL